MLLVLRARYRAVHPYEALTAHVNPQSNPPSAAVLPNYALQFRLIKGLIEDRLEEFYPPPPEDTLMPMRR